MQDADQEREELTAEVARLRRRLAELEERDEAWRRLEVMGSAFAQAPVPMCVLDEQLRYVAVNDRLAELNGLPAADHVGKRPHDVVPFIAPILEADLTRVLQTAQPVRNKLYEGASGNWIVSIEPLTWSDSPARAVAVTILEPPIHDQAQAPMGTVVVFRDVTEERRFEEEALRAQKLESLGVLAGGIAHDFNNILTGILGNIGLAKLYPTHAQVVLERMQEAEMAVTRARDLTQQLLTFSRGGTSLKKTATIGGLIRSSAQFALRGSNVGCDFDIQNNLWLVDVDEGQISQVVNNLVLNAQQAMPEGGRIAVSACNVHSCDIEQGTGPLRRYVRLSVEDHGTGIPREHLSKIFDPYFTTKAAGTGLGLATTYAIVRNHGGTIRVQSQPAKSTVFDLFLPASSSVVVETARQEDEPVAGKGRVLVMDDESIILEVMEKMLEQLGYDSQLTCDGHQLLAAHAQAEAEGAPFDAIIMDLTVPGGMGGRDTIRCLREVDPEVPVIVASGYSNDPIMANFKQFGFTGVMVKPFTVQQLSSCLRSVLASASLGTTTGAPGASEAV